MSKPLAFEEMGRHAAIDRAICAYSIAMMDAGKSFNAVDAGAAIRAVIPDYTMAELWSVIENRVVHLDIHRNELLQLVRHLTLFPEGVPGAAVEVKQTEGGFVC